MTKQNQNFTSLNLPDYAAADLYGAIKYFIYHGHELSSEAHRALLPLAFIHGYSVHHLREALAREEEREFENMLNGRGGL